MIKGKLLAAILLVAISAMMNLQGRAQGLRAGAGGLRVSLFFEWVQI